MDTGTPEQNELYENLKKKPTAASPHRVPERVRTLSRQAGRKKGAHRSRPGLWKKKKKGRDDHPLGARRPGTGASLSRRRDPPPPRVHRGGPPPKKQKRGVNDAPVGYRSECPRLSVLLPAGRHAPGTTDEAEGDRKTVRRHRNKSSSQRTSLNRSQYGGCSTTYDTQTST